jgi:hypothetical protein
VVGDPADQHRTIADAACRGLFATLVSSRPQRPRDSSAKRRRLLFVNSMRFEGDFLIGLSLCQHVFGSDARVITAFLLIGLGSCSCTPFFPRPPKSRSITLRKTRLSPTFRSKQSSAAVQVERFAEGTDSVSSRSHPDICTILDRNLLRRLSPFSSLVPHTCLLGLSPHSRLLPPYCIPGSRMIFWFGSLGDSVPSIVGEKSRPKALSVPT